MRNLLLIFLSLYHYAFSEKSDSTKQGFDGIKILRDKAPNHPILNDSDLFRYLDEYATDEFRARLKSMCHFEISRWMISSRIEYALKNEAGIWKSSPIPESLRKTPRGLRNGLSVKVIGSYRDGLHPRTDKQYLDSCLSELDRTNLIPQWAAPDSIPVPRK